MFVFLFWFMVKESNEFIKIFNNAIYIRIIAVHDKSYKVYCIFSDNGRYFQYILISIWTIIKPLVEKTLACILLVIACFTLI